MVIFVLNSQGKIEQTRCDSKKEWNIEWAIQESESNAYGKCRAFESCNSDGLPIYKCFERVQTKELRGMG